MKATIKMRELIEEYGNGRTSIATNITAFDYCHSIRSGTSHCVAKRKVDQHTQQQKESAASGLLRTNPNRAHPARIAAISKVLETRAQISQSDRSIPTLRPVNSL